MFTCKFVLKQLVASGAVITSSYSPHRGSRLSDTYELLTVKEAGN